MKGKKEIAEELSKEKNSRFSRVVGYQLIERKESVNKEIRICIDKFVEERLKRT